MGNCHRFKPSMNSGGGKLLSDLKLCFRVPMPNRPVSLSVDDPITGYRREIPLDPILCFPIDSGTQAVRIGKESAPIYPHCVQDFEKHQFEFSGYQMRN